MDVKQENIAEYIADMAKQLSDLAQEAGLGEQADLIRRAVAELEKATKPEPDGGDHRG